MTVTIPSGESRALYDTAIRREVVVVGGDQAGLAIGYFLAQQGRDFTILEASDEPAAAWRERWDVSQLTVDPSSERELGAIAPLSSVRCPSRSTARTATVPGSPFSVQAIAPPVVRTSPPPKTLAPATTLIFRRRRSAIPLIPRFEARSAQRSRAQLRRAKLRIGRPVSIRSDGERR